MNKKEFMGSLAKQLKYLPKEDRDDAINYYSEYIEDCGFAPEEDVCEKLGSPGFVAKSLIAECTQKLIDKRDDKKSAKGTAAIVWMTILTIFTLPITLPVAIAILIVFLSLFITIVSVLISFFAAAIAIAVSGLAMIILAFAAPGIGSKLAIIGSGLIMMALGLLILVVTILLSELFVKLIVFICKKMLGKRKEKKDE